MQSITGYWCWEFLCILSLLEKLDMQSVRKETKQIEIMMHSTVRKIDGSEDKIKDLSRMFQFKSKVEREILLPPCPLPPLPPLQFPNQVNCNSFSFKHQGYCFLSVCRNYMDQKLYDCCRVCYNFLTIYGELSFFLTT